VSTMTELPRAELISTFAVTYRDLWSKLTETIPTETLIRVLKEVLQKRLYFSPEEVGCISLRYNATTLCSSMKELRQMLDESELKSESSTVLSCCEQVVKRRIATLMQECVDMEINQYVPSHELIHSYLTKLALSSEQMLAGISVLSRDLEFYLSRFPERFPARNARLQEAKLFLAAIEHVKVDEQRNQTKCSYNDLRWDDSLPVGFSEQAATGKCICGPLLDPAIITEATVECGERLRQAFLTEVERSASDSNEIFQKIEVRDWLGFRQALMTKVMGEYFSFFPVWYSLGAYVSLFLLQTRRGYR